MTSKSEDRSGGKSRPRNRKSDRRKQKAQQAESTEFSSREADQNAPTATSTEVFAEGAAEPALVLAIGAAEPVEVKADEAAEAVVLANDAVEPAEVIANLASEASEAPANGVANATAVPLVGEVLPPDAPPAGGAEPMAGVPVTLLAIGNCYGDYLRRSFQDNRSFVERLMGARSLEQAIEVQNDFARQAYSNFIAESQKLCVLSGELARQIFRPFGIAASITRARRHIT